MTRRITVVVGLSGGVDSTVAALLLKQAKHRVIGVTLRLHACDEPDSGHTRSCCGPQATALAAQSAEQLGIRHYALDVPVEFEAAVLRPAWDEYRRGRTPNPCVHCNAAVKFARLLQIADDLGADAVATGHYARLAHDGGTPILRRGVDAGKDQSYFLFALTPAQLARVRFPLGDWHKADVRRIATEAGLATARQPESQDVCFVSAEGSFPEYLRTRFGAEAAAGDLVDEDGRRLGGHAGAHRFTIGQRRGLGLAGGPFWVRAVDMATGRVELCRDPARLQSAGCRAGGMHWLVPPPSGTRLDCFVQTRYRQRPAACVVTALADDWSSVTASFAEPVSGVTPGQALVLYREDQVLGGGWIDAALRVSAGRGMGTHDIGLKEASME